MHERSPANRLVSSDGFVRLLWQGAVTHFLCVLYLKRAVYESDYVSAEDMTLTAYAVAFTAAVALSESVPEALPIIELGLPCMLYMDFRSFFIAGLLHEGVCVVVGHERQNALQVMLMHWSAGSTVSQMLHVTAWSTCAGAIRERQLQNARKSVDGFLKSAYDVVFAVDQNLQVIGAASELANFLRIQPSQANSYGSMDRVPFLSFVAADDRDSVLTLLSDTSEQIGIAMTVNSSFYLSDGSMVRSQLFHCVDDDLDDALTHWVALRQLGPVEPTPAADGGGNAAFVAACAADGQPATLVPTSHSSASSESSAESYGQGASFASVTFGFDSSQEDLRVLSFQADLTPSETFAFGPPKVSIQESMLSADWMKLRDWFKEGQHLLLNHEKPDSLPSVSLFLDFFKLAIYAKSASLARVACTSHDAQRFILKLDEVVAVPNFDTALASSKTRADGMSCPSKLSAQTLGCIMEEPEETSDKAEQMLSL
eukprot:TRINITY_DN16821_c1_g1_i1.p1 TRINITY_DN16821_c1_g1~~TRINITY_DN16821_c1_g1_i1.p1  ORF type:complete len:538 (+),score=58.96 TRINITY_DN16821_c1_g1_i1:163-1614(+)